MTNIPPVLSGSNQVPSPSQVVQIVSLPEALQKNARATRIEGEVVAQNKDGSVRIRTPEGDIDVVVRGRQPQEGQKVQVEIPPGSPPRTATVRPAPVQAPPPVPKNPPTPTTPVTTQPTPPPLPTTPPSAGQLPAPSPTPVAPNTPPQAPIKDGTTQPSTPATPQQIPSSAPPTLIKREAVANVDTASQKLPLLEPGQTIKIMPAPPNVVQPKPPQPTAAPNLFQSLFQAVKSVLPASTSILNNPIPTPSPLVRGEGMGGGIISTQQPPISSPLTLAAKIISIKLPGGEVLTTQQLAPQIQQPQQTITTPQVTITVKETTSQGQPLFPIPTDNKGAVQNFILQSPAATVPQGTQITLQPQMLQNSVASGLQIALTVPASVPGQPPQIISTPAPGTPSTQTLPPAWRALLPVLQPSTLWPVMDELFQSFYQTTPQAAQIFGRIIPSPANAANFGPAAMLFIAALKSGDLQAWLGDKKLDMIQKLGKSGLMQRLSGEAVQSANAPDAAATDWKSFPIPLLWQNEISKILLHVRKEPQDQENQNGEGGTRFVMDLSLNRMGDVQLDGLVRGQRLDLIIRTIQPISSPMQEAMTTAYATALDGTNIYGEIGFQSDGKGWENILKDENMLAGSA